MNTWIIFLSILIAFPHTLLASSSRIARSESTYAIIGEPISFTEYPGGGIRAGYFFDEQVMTELAYTSSFSNLAGSSRFITSQVDFLARFYTGNSFNLAGGLGFKHTRVNFEQGGVGDVEIIGGRARHDAIGIRFSLGNRWQIKRLIIGCDWFGLYTPLGTVYKKKTGTDNATAKEREKIDKELDRLSDTTEMNLLRLHIGYAF